MRAIKFILCGLLLWSLAIGLRAQCPDFMDLTSSAVTGYYSTNGYHVTSSLIMSVGIMPGRHTLITQQGTDPRTGDQLPLLPDGENAVVKLGNEQVGGETESLVYTFTVDPDNSVLLLKYAVVLEDPGHVEMLQPHFLIQMLDANDELISDCMEYNVISSPSIPGFQTYDPGNGIFVIWRPWTLNGFDLSADAGQTVKLRISTYDCGAGGHFGYAYFTASCISNQLSFTGCDGDQVTISATEGFESYSWNNGSTTPTATYSIQGNTGATCVISTVTGCQITQIVTFAQDTLMQDQTFYDTICEGMDYHNHGFNVPTISTPGDYTFLNTFYDVVNCEEGATNTLYLYVHPLCTYIDEVACEGDTFDAYGFHYDQLSPGEITDSFSVTLPYGCEYTTILHLTVNPATQIPQVINGPNVVCSGTLETYSLENGPPPSSVSYHWIAPNGVTVYSGQATPSAQIFFMPDAPSTVQLTLSVDNGCNTTNIPFDVAVGTSYSNIYSDTACIGNPYTQYGFQLGVQDSTGFFVYILNDTTQQGCDSVSILQLRVAETPSVVALADPTVLCVGSETELHAVGPHASVTLASELPTVGVGDILCTDGTTVHPADWPCNKVAKGVVFYVDTTGDHGWAIDLHDLNTPNTYLWGNIHEDIPNLINYGSTISALSDTSGWQNTAAIRAQSATIMFPYDAAMAVDFENGWYLPAAGQMYHLYAMLSIVNHSLQLVGGDIFSSNVAWQYWTSTEKDYNDAWCLTKNNAVVSGDKYNQYLIRSVCSY